jgi:2'-5' RNA ligase superfamily
LTIPRALAAPIIVTALFGDEDFQWLDKRRREYFPPERNVLRAHLTMFHHLPPSCAPELLRRLRDATETAAPAATLDSLVSLGQGVAYYVHSPELEGVRADIADAFTGLLTPQDQSPWWPHVTIQNKVKPAVAKALLDALWVGFRSRKLAIAGLSAFYYRDGLWEPIAAYRFGGGRSMKPPKSMPQ